MAEEGFVEVRSHSSEWFRRPQASVPNRNAATPKTGAEDWGDWGHFWGFSHTCFGDVCSFQYCVMLALEHRNANHILLPIPSLETLQSLPFLAVSQLTSAVSQPFLAVNQLPFSSIADTPTLRGF
jgi:hypothetical protein